MWSRTGRNSNPTMFATIRRATTRLTTVFGAAVAQSTPASREPEARPTRKAPNVAANAVALLPVAYEIVRKKKISYERETNPLAHARPRTDENRRIGVLAAEIWRDSSGPGNAPRRSRQWATSAPSATAPFIATAT